MRFDPKAFSGNALVVLQSDDEKMPSIPITVTGTAYKDKSILVIPEYLSFAPEERRRIILYKPRDHPTPVAVKSYSAKGSYLDCKATTISDIEPVGNLVPFAAFFVEASGDKMNDPVESGSITFILEDTTPLQLGVKVRVEKR